MKKEGWKEYSQKSWILLPKINGRLIDSFVFYSVFGYSIWFMYNNGGIKQTLISLRSKYQFTN